MSERGTRLIRVDPRRVKVVDSALRPTRWDTMAVEDDLTEYVSLSRVIKATPALRAHGGELVLVSGMPFLRAARRASPPLGEIICSVEAEDETIHRHGLQTVDPGDLLDLYSESKIYRAVELLTFRRGLGAELQKLVEKEISSFFQTVSSAPEIYGGDYLALGEFRWQPEPQRLAWTWQRSDREGQHTLLFLKRLLEIELTAGPIKSWNGIDFKQLSAVSEL